jgi:hypothetical protein
MISNSADDTFEKQLLSEPWVSAKYFDIEKVKKHLPSFKYFLQEDKNLQSYCSDKVFKHVLSKKNLFESKNAKSLGRAGVPCKFMREFLIKLFSVENAENSFAAKFAIVFKERDAKCIEDFVPYFTGFKTLRESLPVDFLTEEGIQALKEILWLMNSVISNIEFSPLLIKIASTILLFCSQAETYMIMRTLLEMNYNLSETYKIRWHFRFTFNDNLKIISSINESIRVISAKSGKEIFDFFESINFPPERLYEDMVYGLMFDYLNMEGIIRLLPLFMIEGVKSLYRLAYALVKTLKADIVKVKSADEVIKTARAKAKQITDINKLFSLAYSFKLTRYNNKYDFQPMPDKDMFAGRRNNFYLPAFSSPSQILKEKEIVKLWSMLPLNIRVKDAKMIYNTETQGYSLSNIYALVEKFDAESEILFVIETTDNDVFGGYMSKMFKHTNNKYDRPVQSHLISFRPNITIYDPIKTSDEIIYCDSQCFMFGGGPDGPAIRLDKDLNNGFSYKGNCFGSPVLVAHKDGEFRVKKMEVYHLD